MNKADKAESLFRTGYNCSQSVYAAFAEELGITVEEPAVRTEEYYQSRPCVKACRRAAEILEEYVKEQKRK